MKKIILNTKHEIQIDNDEIDIVLTGIKSGQPVKVRQGIFNPSYFVAIVQDTERRREHWENNKNLPEGQKNPPKELKDIFQDMKQLAESKRVS